jgi:hypothetical protein
MQSEENYVEKDGIWEPLKSRPDTITSTPKSEAQKRFRSMPSSTSGCLFRKYYSSSELLDAKDMFQQ